jgi:hypothetical protein
MPTHAARVNPARPRIGGRLRLALMNFLPIE